MRKLTRSILATTAVVGLLAIPVAGAGAAVEDEETTVVSFSVTPGSLFIDQGNNGAAVDLGASAFSIGAQSFEGPMNDITVTDEQNLLGTWCVDVELSDADGDGSPGFESTTHEIDGSNGVMWVTGLVIGDGFITNSTTAITAELGVPLNTGGTLAKGETALGGGTLTYTPNIRVTVPEDAPNGDYSGTITHTAVTGCSIT